MEEIFSITIGNDIFPCYIWNNDTFPLIAKPGDIISLVIEHINPNINDKIYLLNTNFNSFDWIIVASSSLYNIIIHPNDLYIFFLRYINIKWIVYNSEKTFIVLLKALQQIHPQYIDILWECIENGNYRDIELLGKLYYLIENDKEIKNLHELIYKTTNVNLSPLIHKYNKKIKQSSYKMNNISYNNYNNLWIYQKKRNIIHAIGIRFTWIRLEYLCLRIMNIYNDEMYSDALSSYGLLTDIIQVKSKIALFFIHLRGIYIDKEQLNKLKKQYLLELHTLAEELLCILPYSRRIFSIGLDGNIVVNNNSIPEINIDALYDSLYLIYKELYTEDKTIKIKFNKNQQNKKHRYPININQWESHKHKHPFLNKWINFERKKIHYEYLERISQYIPYANPTWNYLQSNGRASCTQPNIQVTPKISEIRSIFIPKKGYSFLIVDYKFIELCSFAAISEFKFNYSMLAKVIRDNNDPHSYTASVFYSYLLPEFLKLKETNPEEYKLKRDLAKFLNFAILSGIGLTKLHEQVQITCKQQMDIDILKNFKYKLLRQVYPEMALYQFSDRVSLWIRNLGCTRREFMQNCIFPKSTKYSRKHENKIMRILKGRNYNGYIKWEKQFWKSLVNINRNSTLVEILQTAYSKNKGSIKLANALCSYTSCTLTGRIRRNINWSVHNNIGFSGLAADGAKLALWNLEYVGFRTVGFIHDEFIIEINKEKDNIELALEIICDSMQQVVRNIPIRCEYICASHWTSPDILYSLK